MKSRRGKTFTHVTIASLILIIIGLILIFICAPHTMFESQLSSIGLSLITAGIVSVSIDKISLKEISIELNRVVEDGLHELRMMKYGVVEIVSDTPYREIHEAMEASKGFTLVQTWSPDMKNILHCCESILVRGGWVTIFLLHPASPAAEQRSLDLQEKARHVPEKIRSDTEAIRSMYRRLVGKQNRKASHLETRLRLFYYSSLPSFALYKTDKKAWVAFYWHGVQSDSGMNLVIDFHTHNSARKYYESHLDFLERAAVQVGLKEDEEPAFRQIIC